MKLIKTIQELKNNLDPLRTQGRKIGFVPTMGALHEGHLSLVNTCAAQNDITVVSIYVNPTQFNNKIDLVNYPRDLDEDLKKLIHTDCDFVFSPDDQEMYPEEDNREFDFGLLGEVMEGKHRPGHFNGVAKIVTKLFDIVQPDRAYFGQKDFQQLAIIRFLTKKLNYAITIVACPIIREADGLAMSSRNLLLSAEYRKVAPVIFKTLIEAKKLISEKKASEIIDYIIHTINSTQLLTVEYCQIVDRETLQNVAQIRQENSVVCIAVFAGKIRLIDNVEFIS